MNIHPNPLPYTERLDRRELSEVSLLVIHCTELPDLASARIEGEIPRYPSGTGNSGHYYVDRDGRIEEYVPVRRIAHHTRGYNAHSIGIEIVNLGRFPDWLHSQHQAMVEAYTEAQIQSLTQLISNLEMVYPTLTHIAGHEDLDRTEVPATDDHEIMVRRKRDPGQKFPWKRILDGCGLQRLQPN